MVKESGLATNLIKNLVRNLGWEKELALAFKETSTSKDIVLDKIQSEQISIFKILFGIFYDLNQHIKSGDKDKFLDYMLQTDFKGNTSNEHVRSEPNYGLVHTDKKDLIKNLGQMCALAMLGLHEDSQAADMQHKIETSNLSQASLFVYLPLIIRKKQTELFKDQIN